MQAQAPKATPKVSDGDGDDGAISGAVKMRSVASPALQAVISSLTKIA